MRFLQRVLDRFLHVNFGFLEVVVEFPETANHAFKVLWLALFHLVLARGTVQEEWPR